MANSKKYVFTGATRVIGDLVLHQIKSLLPILFKAVKQ